MVLLAACAAPSEAEHIADELEKFRVGGAYSPTYPHDGNPVSDVSAMYFAAALADSVGRAEGMIPVGEVKEHAKSDPGCDEVLFVAATLHILRESGLAIEEKAASCTLVWLKEQGVTKANAEGVEFSLQMLERLGYADDIPPLQAELFEVKNRADRYHAWQTIALSPYLSNEEEARSHFKKQISEAGDFLDSVSVESDASLGEVVAASRVVERDGNPEGVKEWLGQVRGCGEVKALYRPTLSAPGCTLKDTWTALMSGITPP
ncbi:hypothetical protein JJV70_07385 [Streptomyces sp. JJ66]|uniref:hypothetical protein n=1 Tax=Streptomyces sp. JJ66 TaxID=2803843 RepID=UPI001C55E625|nr:hypothetical protein [Streptomyces sp. JJ66]MBW1601935.1 hypothetical protein [Streptomyces sp. JJ66]